eukprot:gene1446-12065_t
MSSNTKLLDLCTKYGIEYSRNNILSMYRKILKEGRKLQTEGRRKFVEFKTMDSFREYKDETDPEIIVRQIRVALYQIDTIKVQKENLKHFFEDDRKMKNEKTEEEILNERTTAYQKSLEKTWD